MDFSQDRLAPEVLEQLEELTLSAARPMIISDADEVVFAFVKGLEQFLEEQQLYLDLRSFALTGNIRRRRDDVAVPGMEVNGLLVDFFSQRTGQMPVIEGAVEALNHLSQLADILILSNLPLAQRKSRQMALEAAGLKLPVVANSGLKGPAVKWLSQRNPSKKIFLDDIPHNLESVAHHAPDVHLIHFVGDERLAPLIDKSPSSHARIDDWKEALDYILSYIDGPDGTEGP